MDIGNAACGSEERDDGNKDSRGDATDENEAEILSAFVHVS